MAKEMIGKLQEGESSQDCGVSHSTEAVGMSWQQGTDDLKYWLLTQAWLHKEKEDKC